MEQDNLKPSGQRGPMKQDYSKPSGQRGIMERGCVQRYTQWGCSNAIGNSKITPPVPPVSRNMFHSYVKSITMQQSKYHVGDQVYVLVVDSTVNLQRQGPFLIARVLGRGKYILCDCNGNIVQRGREIDEKDLVPV